ncbi:MAG: 3-deoxy-manno-octulosonate-8-phosphatase KdsC [Gammaproteobacteria bacterium]
MQDVLQRAANIRLVIFDVDGVLTDGGLFIDTEGREHKVFHSRDGHGMKMLQHNGVAIAIITGRSSPAVAHRMASLGIEHLYQGQQDKLPAFHALLEKLGLAPEQVAYVGDDVVDLPIMCRVGLAVAVQDAHELVKRHAHWLTASAGGRGAARDVCELILEAQGHLEAALAQYLAVPPS